MASALLAVGLRRGAAQEFSITSSLSTAPKSGGAPPQSTTLRMSAALRRSRQRPGLGAGTRPTMTLGLPSTSARLTNPQSAIAPTARPSKSQIKSQKSKISEWRFDPVFGKRKHDLTTT
jgi:hypothetical protein